MFVFDVKDEVTVDTIEPEFSGILEEMSWDDNNMSNVKKMLLKHQILSVKRAYEYITEKRKVRNRNYDYFTDEYQIFPSESFFKLSRAVCLQFLSKIRKVGSIMVEDVGKKFFLHRFDARLANTGLVQIPYIHGLRTMFLVPLLRHEKPQLRPDAKNEDKELMIKWLKIIASRVERKKFDRLVELVSKKLYLEAEETKKERDLFVKEYTSLLKRKDVFLLIMDKYEVESELKRLQFPNAVLLEGLSEEQKVQESVDNLQRKVSEGSKSGFLVSMKKYLFLLLTNKSYYMQKYQLSFEELVGQPKFEILQGMMKRIEVYVESKSGVNDFNSKLRLCFLNLGMRYFKGVTSNSVLQFRKIKNHATLDRKYVSLENIREGRRLLDISDGDELFHLRNLCMNIVYMCRVDNVIGLVLVDLDLSFKFKEWLRTNELTEENQHLAPWGLRGHIKGLKTEAFGMKSKGVDEVKFDYDVLDVPKNILFNEVGVILTELDRSDYIDANDILKKVLWDWKKLPDSKTFFRLEEGKNSTKKKEFSKDHHKWFDNTLNIIGVEWGGRGTAEAVGRITTTTKQVQIVCLKQDFSPKGVYVTSDHRGIAAKVLSSWDGNTIRRFQFFNEMKRVSARLTHTQLIGIWNNIRNYKKWLVPSRKKGRNLVIQRHLFDTAYVNGTGVEI